MRSGQWNLRPYTVPPDIPTEVSSFSSDFPDDIGILICYGGLVDCGVSQAIPFDADPTRFRSSGVVRPGFESVRDMWMSFKTTRQLARVKIYV